MRALRSLAGLIPLVTFLVAIDPRAADATVIVRIEPALLSVDVGSAFSIDLVADFGNERVVGWGLDLIFDSAVLSLLGPPVIGPFWDASYAPDGDGLAGAANPFSDPDGDGIYGSISGSSVLLATLTFTADALGSTDVTPGYTESDLNEGFALDPTGFADVMLESGRLTVIPEPGTGILVISLAMLSWICPYRDRRAKRLAPTRPDLPEER